MRAVVSTSTVTGPRAPEGTDHQASCGRNDSHGGPAGAGLRPITVGGRRAGSAAGRWSNGVAWLVLVAAVMVAGAGAFGAVQIQQDASQRHELRTMLAEIKASAWQQSALQWQAISAQNLTPTLAQQHQERHRVAHALAVQLAERDPDSAETREVQIAFDHYYHDVLAREFALLASGQVDDARRMYEEQVDPAFERLVTALTAADRAYAVRAAQATAQARLGTVLILTATALIVGGLVWLQRAGSQAYGRVAHRASHDPLTGLPNRSLLDERIAQAVWQADRKQSSAAVLLIDLDRFKEVNDTFGHHYGDELLVLVARRMQGALRHGDTVARLGGDEFAVLLPHVESAEDVAAAATTICTALQSPFVLDGHSLTVAASVGAALYPEHGSDADDLLLCADTAMYAAKTSRIQVAVFDPGIDRLGHGSVQPVATP